MFTHPKEVCMTYLTHMKLSLYFSYTLFVGSVKSFVHAFIPDVYITSTSDLSSELYKTLKSSGCQD
jgi:hypothetical protein